LLPELQELYQSIVVGDCLGIDPTTEFPQLASKCLQDGTLPVEASFEFSEGGRFIWDRRPDNRAVQQLVCLFAAVVTYSSKHISTAIWSKKDAFEMSPDMLIDFAWKARHRGSLRLLKRMHRHNTDSKAGMLDGGAKGSIVSYDSKIGLVIDHWMKPSYRAAIYDI
jgi:hypothetical protein